MYKEEIKGLKSDFLELINKVKPKQDNQLLNELIAINKIVEHHDGLIRNKLQDVSRFFKFDIKKKQRAYVEDILDNYQKYSDEEKSKIQSELIRLVEKYDKLNRNLVDKIKSVLRFT